MNHNFNYFNGASASGTPNRGYPNNLEALSGLLLLNDQESVPITNNFAQREELNLFNLNYQQQQQQYQRLIYMANPSNNTPPHLLAVPHLSMNPVTRTYNINFNETRTSSPISSSAKLHEVFQTITEDHKYSNNPAFIAQNNNNEPAVNRQAINKPNHSPTDSGYSQTFLDDHHNFPAPVLATSLGNHMKPQECILPMEAVAEYEKIERESHHLKQTFIETKLAECPVDYGYNESKSRLRRSYEDPVMEEGRAKNNLASRRSRYKKKLASRLLSINYDYDVVENRNLFDQEQWLLGVIAELEQQVFDEGVDINTLKALRHKCGLK